MRAVRFQCQVMGVGPNYADIYCVTLGIKGKDGETACTHTTEDQTCEASGSPTSIQLRVTIPEAMLESGLDGCTAEVVCSGKDVEHWAGNFGTRFRREKLLLELDSPLGEEGKDDKNYEKSLVALFGTSKVPLTGNFSCFFQAGMGASYFIDGRKVPAEASSNYSNLTEFDWTLGFNRTLDNVENAWIESDGDHYIGGTSLVIKGEEGAEVKLQEFEAEAEFGACKVEIVYKTE